MCFSILLIRWRIGATNRCYKYRVKSLTYGYLELSDGAACWKPALPLPILYSSVGGFMSMECFVIDDAMLLYLHII